MVTNRRSVWHAGLAILLAHSNYKRQPADVRNTSPFGLFAPCAAERFSEQSGAKAICFEQTQSLQAERSFRALQNTGNDTVPPTPLVPMVPITNPPSTMESRLIAPLRTGLLALVLVLAAPAAFAQTGSAPDRLASEDVPDEEIEAAAEIVVTMQMQQRRMRQEMRQQYGNPQAMDSTQRRQARREIMQEREALMQQKTEEEGLSPQRLNLIMNSARRDSTLRGRMKTAVQELRQEKMRQQPRMPRGPGRTTPDSTEQNGGGR